MKSCYICVTKKQNAVEKRCYSTYRNGYCTAWDEDKGTILATRAGDGITPSLVRAVVNEWARRGFREETLLGRFGTLSSTAIRKRCVAVYGSGGRKDPGRSLLALVALCTVLLHNLSRHGG